MFVKPYYAEKNGHIYYYLVESTGEDGMEADMKFFINQKKVDQVRGATGIFELNGPDAKLHIENKWLGSTIGLTVDGVELTMQKIKRKELKHKLAAKGYYNEFNQSKATKEALKLKFADFIFPMVLLSIASVVYFLVVDSSNKWISFIAYFAIFIAGLSFTSVLSNRYTWMNTGKLPILLAFGFTFAVGSLLNILNYGTWETSGLRAQLGTDKSREIVVPITEINYQGETYVKSRKIDPYHIQYYEFGLDGEDYEGRYTSDSLEYKVGDSIRIYYLISDPRINRAIQD